VIESLTTVTSPESPTCLPNRGRPRPHPATELTGYVTRRANPSTSCQLQSHRLVVSRLAASKARRPFRVKARAGGGRRLLPSPISSDRLPTPAIAFIVMPPDGASSQWRRSGRPARPRRSPKAGPTGRHTESPWCVGSPVLVAPRNVLMALGSAEPRGPGPSSASAGQLHAAGLKRGAARVSHEEARRRRRRRGQWAGVPRSRSVRRTLRLQFSSPIEAVAPVSIRVEGTALWKSSDRNLVARRMTRESGRVPRPASQFWGTTRRPGAPRRPRSGWPGLPASLA
jgi:hypothetical protein